MANILVTGANQGIGWHLVRQLLEDGHSAAVLDLETKGLEELAGQYPGRLYPFVCDVRDEERVRQCVREAEERMGTVDLAVHNACLCTFQNFEQSEDDLYRRVLDVNYFGALHLARAVLPVMEARGRGKIIFTSSGVGVTGFSGISPYASGKGALEALAKCLDLEYRKRGITFHLFHPPLTRTCSSAPLPVPQEFMADPAKVGAGLAKRIGSRKFVICHSRMQSFQVRLCYLWPLILGRLMCRMTERAQENDKE